MPEYVLNRKYNLLTTAGCVSFEKNTPTWVPPHMVAAAVAIGASPVDGEAPHPLGDEKEVASALVGDERKSQLYGAFELLIEENDSAKFTGQGIPQVKVIEEMVGFDVDKTEVHEAWKAFKLLKAEMAGE